MTRSNLFVPIAALGLLALAACQARPTAGTIVDAPRSTTELTSADLMNGPNEEGRAYLGDLLFSEGDRLVVERNVCVDPLAKAPVRQCAYRYVATGYVVRIDETTSGRYAIIRVPVGTDLRTADRISASVK